ncbi:MULTISPECIES: ribonuclease P protein component [Roseateles]|uniref:Ribonuclease P protein component n=1 Tax=Pelomonas caseinilytica TaxID=2906763 RepID=A0ABS8XJR8_9BURK|nr:MULTISPECIES: ribonuclease P protein component [unclassified Roseateles]MCE4539975.1 ribonuclease P protein component [Pelomonas sp. P7]HEV6967998.1 ribonuclease P protein component [Roseateles sp.]
MIGRIQRPVDFERVLARPSRARSAHFALHHLPSNPAPSAWAAARLRTAQAELSTGEPQAAHSAVEQLPGGEPGAPSGCWLGMVVPKRHARRAVTRTLLKRQIRAAFAAAAGLPPGLWVVRLRSPFDRQQFPSAASDALRQAAHAELAQLFGRALTPRPARPGAPA